MKRESLVLLDNYTYYACQVSVNMFRKKVNWNKYSFLLLQV